jgi:NAD+ diphosphatase
MIAEHDGRALLGRQPAFPPGRYSALAGFLEPGESIEEAVARELFEEAGVRVRHVRYIASQPWPFPSSLMIACVAEAVDDRLTIDTTELEDAIWVSRDEVRAALAGDGSRFGVPPSYAIAHTLLEAWAAQ